MTYHEFLESNQSPWTILSLYSWYIFGSICAILIPYPTGNMRPDSGLRFLGVIPMLFHGYHFIQQKHFLSWRPQPFRLYHLGDQFLLILTFLSSAALFASALGICRVSLCVENINARQLQPYLLLQHAIIPIIAPVLMKAHSKWCAYLVYLISFSTTIVSAVLVNITLSGYFSLAVFYLLQMIIVYDNEATLSQLYSNYLNGEQHLQMKMKTIQEREQLLMQGEEASSFYGNVAHDLKSPLQGFTTELETLERDFFSSSSLPIASFSSPTPSPTPSPFSRAGTRGRERLERERAEEGERRESQLQESVVVMKSICCFMLMTINRAIDYSKAATGQLLTPTLEPVKLSDAIDWAVKCVSPLNELPIKVEPLSDSMSAAVVTDKHWLMENLLCLVSNALKFTVDDGSINVRCFLQSNVMGRSGLLQEEEEGSSHLRVASQTQPPRTADPAPPMVVVLEVEDSGNETNPRDLVYLFQPHKATDRREGGTGLGLYSILKRVEALGGSCGVKSRRDGTKGSRFWFSFPYEPCQSSSLPMSFSSSREINMGFSLPVSTPTAREREEEDNEEQEEAETMMRRSVTIGGIPRKILLVEDSVMIQKTTSRALRNEGHVVDIARDGAECLKMVTDEESLQANYGLILMDIQMPVMDGIEATRRIREMERVGRLEQSGSSSSSSRPRRFSSHQIIIGLSANSDPETMRQALAAGMDAFIPKPLTTKSLKDCFEQVMSSQE
jgi:signal transduction histidine kinase/AmiR/NasT family two-component response regulator